jgi:endonuclease YncB( thermonuclease family)
VTAPDEMPDLPALGWLGTPAPSGMSAPAELICGRCNRSLLSHSTARMPDGRLMAWCLDGQPFSTANVWLAFSGSIDHIEIDGDHTYGREPEPESQPRAVAQSLSEFAGHRWPYLNVTWRAWYLANYDGDTLSVRVDRGWFDTSVMDLRLLGVDAYEVESGAEEYRVIGRAARDWVAAELARCGRDLQLDTMLITNQQSPTEKYGRFLCRCTYLDGTEYRDLATELRVRGYHKKSSTIEAVPPWPSALPKTLVAGVHYAVREA